MLDMKTKILKWDLRIQVVLDAFNLLLFAMPYGWVVVGCFQPFFGCYHLLSSIVQLAANHKSTAFRAWRKRHLLLQIAYPLAGLALYFLITLNHINLPDNSIAFNVLLAILGMVIPQLTFYANTWLCYRELQFLENREFFILK
jgi:hypothetical protein